MTAVRVKMCTIGAFTQLVKEGPIGWVQSFNEQRKYGFYLQTWDCLSRSRSEKMTAALASRRACQEDAMGATSWANAWRKAVSNLTQLYVCSRYVANSVDWRVTRLHRAASFNGWANWRLA